VTTVGEIHRFIPGPGADAPTILLLHGTGGDENDLVPLAREVSPAAALLAPRGPVLEHGMPRFFRRLAVGVFDLEDLALRTRELADFVGDSAVQYGFNPARVFALGYSNGANIAASLLLTDGSVVAGAMLFRAMLPFEPREPADLTAKPVFLAAGRSDPYASVAQVEALADRLRRAGSRVEVSWSDGGHGLNQREISAAGEWFGREAG
jgi:predicted esterase